MFQNSMIASALACRGFRPADLAAAGNQDCYSLPRALECISLNTRIDVHTLFCNS